MFFDILQFVIAFSWVYFVLFDSREGIILNSEDINKMIDLG